MLLQIKLALPKFRFRIRFEYNLFIHIYFILNLVHNCFLIIVVKFDFICVISNIRLGIKDLLIIKINNMLSFVLIVIARQ